MTYRDSETRNQQFFDMNQQGMNKATETRKPGQVVCNACMRAKDRTEFPSDGLRISGRCTPCGGFRKKRTYG